MIVMQGSKTCLLRVATAVSRLYMQWHQYHCMNQYPVAGGILDQPMKYVDAMNVLSQVELDSKE